MKIIVTTSDRYLHIVPVFTYLFNKYWNASFELVGYKRPDNVPSNCTFYSLGDQGPVSDFSGDMIKYFSQQPDWFVWLMEDTFIRQPINYKIYDQLVNLAFRDDSIGRISLSPDSIKYYTQVYNAGLDFTVYRTPTNSDYRLSTQPAIWNKKYLLNWLKPGHSPWEFETLKGEITKFPDHDFKNLALDKYHAPLIHNEGVRKKNIFHYDLSGMHELDIEYIKALTC